MQISGYYLSKDNVEHHWSLIWWKLVILLSIFDIRLKVVELLSEWPYVLAIYKAITYALYLNIEIPRIVIVVKVDILYVCAHLLSQLFYCRVTFRLVALHSLSIHKAANVVVCEAAELYTLLA